MTGRDKNATWRSLDETSRVPGWPKGRIWDEIDNRRLPFRGYVQGIGNVTGDTLDTLINPDWMIGEIHVADNTMVVFWQDRNGTGELIEGVEVPVAADDASPAPSPEPTQADVKVMGGAQWAVAATRELKAAKKIPEGMKKAELARLLEAESEKAVKAGRIGRALKASYLENQLVAWGIWPLA